MGKNHASQYANFGSLLAEVIPEGRYGKEPCQSIRQFWMLTEEIKNIG